jgi:hypothetical protein
MSPRQEKPQPLSDTDIQSIAADLGRGNQPMVWFTSLAIGVEEGRSGKVVTLGDPDEGDFVHVKPTGSKDVLSFSPTEVTLTKPAPKRAAPVKPAPVEEVKPAETATAETTPAENKSPDAKPGNTKPAATKTPADEQPAVAKTGSRSAGAARKAKPAETTVTLLGGVDGEWTVDVQSGKTRPVRGLPVTGAAVAQAAKALHPEVHEAIEAVLEAARGAQRAKVEQLQAELAEAKRMLEELSD